MPTARLRPDWYRPWLLAALAIGFACRLALAVYPPSVPVGDEMGFRATAVSIAEGRGHVTDGNVVFKAPLYPALLAAVYWFGGNDLAARIMQAVLGAGLVLLVASFARWVLDPRSAVIAAWFAAVYPVFLTLAPRLLSEALFTFLVAAALAALGWLLAARDWKRAVLVGALCGLIALTRASGLGFAVVLSGLFVALAVSVPIRSRLLLAATILVACALVVSPWTVRNWVRVGALVPVSVEFGRNLYSGWVSVPDGRLFGNTAVDDTTRYADAALGEVERDRYVQEKAVAFLQSRPSIVPRYIVLKSMYFWSPLDWDVIGYGQGTFNGLYVALMPFVFLGLWVTWRQAPSAFWICVVTTAYFWALALLGSTTPRYRYPAEPALFAIAAAGLLAFVADTASRHHRWIAAGWVGANALAIPFSSQMRLLLREILVRLGLW